MRREQNPSCVSALKADTHEGFCSSMLQAHFACVSTHEGAFAMWPEQTSVTGRWVDDESGLGSRTRNNGRSSVLGRFYENQMPSLFESAEQSEDFTVSSLILFRMS